MKSGALQWMNLRGEEGKGDHAKGLRLEEWEYSGTVKRNTRIH